MQYKFGKRVGLKLQYCVCKSARKHITGNIKANMGVGGEDVYWTGVCCSCDERSGYLERIAYEQQLYCVWNIV
jgi:hypothetical protein